MFVREALRQIHAILLDSSIGPKEKLDRIFWIVEQTGAGGD